MTQKTKLSTKGQVVLPKSLRTKRHWKPGTEFVVREQEGSILLIPKPTSKGGNWHTLLGCLPYSGPRKTIHDMDQAVAAEARSRK